MVFRPCRSAGARVQEASWSSVWRWRRAQVLLPGARRPLWSVKTVGWGHGGGLEISRRWHPSVIPLVDGTWVTDGRVDDQLVWWFQHSKLSAWLSVRVPPETPIEARQNRSDCHGRCPVRGHLAESDLWAAMLDGDVTHGWMAWVGSGHLGGE